MIDRLFIGLLACLFLLPATAMAEDLLMHDSVYYTMDDGIMTLDEMELEADQVFKMCQINHFQNTNFNCECLAGSFLIEREKRGPMVPQLQILTEITKTKPVACANTVNIAGNTYSSCMRQSKQRRALTNDLEEYCGCVGNKVANDFTKKPRLTTGYVQSLTYNSMIFCQKPENRPKTASSGAEKGATEQSAKTAN